MLGFWAYVAVMGHSWMDLSHVCSLLQAASSWNQRLRRELVYPHPELRCSGHPLPSVPHAGGTYALSFRLIKGVQLEEAMWHDLALLQSYRQDT